MWNRRRLLLVLASGLLGAASFPIAFPIGPRRELFASGILEPLAFICLVPTLIAIRGLSARRASIVGFVAGWVFFTAAFWWVNVAMTTFGGMPNIASIPALLMLSGWCAIHWGLAFWAVRLFDLRLGWPMGATLGPAWMATELLRNYNCSGFPWANLGYSQMRDLWLSQLGSIGGVYAVALLIAVVNGALYEVLRARWSERAFPRRLVGLASAFLVASLVYGAIRVPIVDRRLREAPTVKVAVVQGNIDQKLKNSQSTHAAMVLSAFNPPNSAADDANADLIVWPEAAFPIPFVKGSRLLTNHGLERPRYRAHLLLGVDIYDPRDLQRGNENGAYLVDRNLIVTDSYTKHHLVPFGEYVLWDLDKLLPIDNLVPGTFVPGKTLNVMHVPLARGGEARIGTEICFDAIFPEISRAYANSGAQVLVNMSNDAWYGFSSAPFQFLRMVAMRAVETGRPFARAANTGISGFIDPLGRIYDQTPIGLVQSEDNWVDASMRIPPEWRMRDLPLLEGRTVYDVIGDWPSYLASAFCVVGIALAWRRRRQ